MKYPILSALVLTIVLSFVPTASGQTTPARVTRTLQKLVQDKATPQTLWNMGFILFYRYGSSREMARTIADGYAAVAGQGEKQNELLKKAALFWNKEYQYWNGKRPGDRYYREKDDFYWVPRRNWETSLETYPPGEPSIRSKYPRIWKYHSQYEKHWSRDWDSTLKMYRSRGQ